MKMNFAAFAVLVGISLIGCGAPTVAEESELLGENTQTLCSSTQNCWDGSTVSCTGNATCTVGSASVTCDGTVTACPPVPCNAGITCTEFKKYACSEWDEGECCGSTGPQYCYCNYKGIWLCN